MQNLSPDEREAALARMRARGFDPNGQGAPGAGGAGRGGDAAANGVAGQAPGRRAGAQPAGGTQSQATATGPSTIDALFAPLPRTQTVGRAWLQVDGKLQPVRLRLGITDGQTTELIEGDVKEGSEVVTNVVIAGQTTRPAATAFPGFGAPGGRQGFPGGGFGGQGGGAGGARGGR